MGHRTSRREYGAASPTLFLSLPRPWVNEYFLRPDLEMLVTPGGFSSQGPWALLTVSCEAPLCRTQTIKVQLRRSPALQIDLSVTPQLQPWRRPSQLHAWLCSSKIPAEERQQRRGRGGAAQGVERGREGTRAEEIPRHGGRQNWRNYVVPEIP